MGKVKILKASAGSGKTFMLAYEYVKSVIAEQWQYRHILAVTFTNKATEEMKHRIISELNSLARGGSPIYVEMLERDLKIDSQEIKRRALVARGRILHDYSHFSILTIDKFFQRIIRSFVRELGVDVHFNLELKTDSILESAVDGIIEDISTDAKLKKWIISFAQEKIQSGKRWNIKRELVALGGEIFKEEYKLINKEGHTRESIEKVVVLAKKRSDNAKGQLQEIADEALKYIDDAGLSVKDFAYGAASFASFFVKVSKGDFSKYGQRVTDVLDGTKNIYTKSSKLINEIKSVEIQVISYLEKLATLHTQEIVYINSVDVILENYRNLALLNDLALKIQEQCTQNNIMPISATNDILKGLIVGNDTPFIFEKVGTHFTQFMIDEFQDTSAMQWANFVPLLENALSQSEQSPVLLVGDIKQSIYRWRGGDWRILDSQVEEALGETDTHNLDSNYRSCRQVVEFNNNLIEQCIMSDTEELNNQLSEAKDVKAISGECFNLYKDMLASAYSGHQQKAKAGGREGYVNITKYGDGEEFIPPVVSRVEELQERGYRAKDIAILVRGNGEGRKIANMLLDYKNSNPDSKYCYDVMTQEALMIGNSQVVQFIVSTLSLAISDSNAIRLAIYNRFLGRDYVEPFRESDIEFMESVKLLPPLEALDEIVIHHNLDKRISDIAYVQAFQEQIIEFSRNTIADIQLFIKWWEAHGKKESISVPKGSNAITIITIHKSKGLEFPCVIIPYCNWALNPKTSTILWSNAKEETLAKLSYIPLSYKADIAHTYFAEDYFKERVLAHIDNINVLYVAVTRAREELHIMFPDKKEKSPSVSKLITDAIIPSQESCRIKEFDGRYDQENRVYEFGGKIDVEVAQTAASSQNFTYITNRPSERIKLSLPSQRYYEEDGTFSLTPRNYGILMHKVFENATGREDIYLAIDNLVQHSTISTHDAKQLGAVVEHAFSNSIVEEWFSDKWDIVKNEQEILIPNGNGIRRPDRVMIKGDTVQVVDYKFGLERSGSHSSQIIIYKNLLKQMGYKKIKGYVWYISLEDVVEV